MMYDVAVKHDYDMACELYHALTKIKCEKLSYPCVCYLRETVMKNKTHPCRYGYRIEKNNNGGYMYVSYLDIDESKNFISLDKFLQIILPERTVTL